MEVCEKSLMNLNHKKIQMINDFRKDYGKLKVRFDKFIRSDVNDLQSLKWAY